MLLRSMARFKTVLFLCLALSCALLTCAAPSSEGQKETFLPHASLHRALARREVIASQYDSVSPSFSSSYESQSWPQADTAVAGLTPRRRLQVGLFAAKLAINIVKRRVRKAIRKRIRKAVVKQVAKAVITRAITRGSSTVVPVVATP